MEITLAIGYKRRRSVLGGAVEGHMVTAVLLVAGVIVVVIVVVAIFQLAQKLPI